MQPCFCRAKLRSVRMESYWKKVCEDERRSKLRNQQIISDLDRLDSQISDLDEQIGSLVSMKVK